MAKVVFIGAGSLGFTRGLVRDLLTFPLLRDATLALVDIDAKRLDFGPADYRSRGLSREDRGVPGPEGRP